MTYYDEAEIRKTLSLMKADNELFEVRILHNNGMVVSGYFKDVDIFLKEFQKQSLKGTNVYISLNEPKDACFSREQGNCFLEAKKSIATTSDSDIYAYDWFMVDLDPVRPAKTSSSDAELAAAKKVGNKIYTYMKDLGFNEPLMGCSGNGVHLLYRVNLSVSEDNKALIVKALKALDYLFSTDEIKVDNSVFNAGRVCKLYGTLVQKGKNTNTRPHRMAYIVGNPSIIKANDKSYLEKLCKIIPKEPDRKKYNNYSPADFNLDDWLDKYGLRYTKKSWSDADKYVLDECPFDSSHKAPDSCVLKFRNGAIAFTCFHNSCSDKTWQDLRVKYEPEAYEKRQEYIEKQMYKSFNRDAKSEPKHIQAKEGAPVFYTANEIIHRNRPIEQIIRSGITEFDKHYRGFRKKDVTIVSGQTGGAKSTILSQFILNAVNAGNNVATFSGELDDGDFMKWMNLQAAGKNFVQDTKYENYFEVPFKYQERIADWLENHFWLYNNEYGFDFNAIIEQLDKMITDHKLDMLCIDNLMALDISALSKEKYEAQSAFAWKVHELAQKKNVHIIIVCHPRKPMGLLGMYDISGTSDIVNAVDNILFVYRVNQSFTNSYKQYFGRDWAKGGTNVWHCAKSRFGSVDDEYYPLWYELETKRLKNDISENIIYGWMNPQEKQEKISADIDQLEFEDVVDMSEIPFD